MSYRQSVKGVVIILAAVNYTLPSNGMQSVLIDADRDGVSGE